MVVQCCKCRRVQHDGEWNHIDISGGSAISHTYCPPCHRAAMDDLRPSDGHYREYLTTPRVANA